jgi:hypothetical protein
MAKLGAFWSEKQQRALVLAAQEEAHDKAEAERAKNYMRLNVNDDELRAQIRTEAAERKAMQAVEDPATLAVLPDEMLARLRAQGRDVRGARELSLTKTTLHEHFLEPWMRTQGGITAVHRNSTLAAQYEREQPDWAQIPLAILEPDYCVTVRGALAHEATDYIRPEIAARLEVILADNPVRLAGVKKAFRSAAALCPATLQHFAELFPRADEAMKYLVVLRADQRLEELRAVVQLRIFEHTAALHAQQKKDGDDVLVALPSDAQLGELAERWLDKARALLAKDEAPAARDQRVRDLVVHIIHPPAHHLPSRKGYPLVGARRIAALRTIIRAADFAPDLAGSKVAFLLEHLLGSQRTGEQGALAAPNGRDRDILEYYDAVEPRGITLYVRWMPRDEAGRRQLQVHEFGDLAATPWLEGQETLIVK